MELHFLGFAAVPPGDNGAALKNAGLKSQLCSVLPSVPLDRWIHFFEPQLSRTSSRVSAYFAVL